MGFATNYLAKHSPGNSSITEAPEKNLNYIVVIPAYNESGLIQCLESLYYCDLPEAAVEIITVINWPFNAEKSTVKLNQEIAEKARLWSKNHNLPQKKFHFIVKGGSARKNSGVGFARKTGMDEAVNRFNTLSCPEGIILSLDADAQVEKNYFTAIERFFTKNNKLPACNIYFEHPLSGSLNPEVYTIIAEYELHMRYYLNGLRYSGHPNCYHTLGSAFCVKAEEYCRQGGMNRRQAGEDFYFLQKLFDTGKFGECNSTIVSPSPRPSERVPFGTGPVVSEYLRRGKCLLTFNPSLFSILKEFINFSSEFYSLAKNESPVPTNLFHPVLEDFLRTNSFEEKLREIYENSSGELSFKKRFFRWFNMFRVLKFLNYAKHVFPDIQTREAAKMLLKNLSFKNRNENTLENLLLLYRQLDKMNT